MSPNNLTKEEMKSYIKISNLLEENKKSIDKILSINRDNFNKYNIYSSVYSKMNIFFHSFALSLIVFLLISCIYVIFLGLKGLLISTIIGGHYFLVYLYNLNYKICLYRKDSYKTIRSFRKNFNRK